MTDGYYSKWDDQQKSSSDFFDNSDSFARKVKKSLNFKLTMVLIFDVEYE